MKPALLTLTALLASAAPAAADPALAPLKPCYVSAVSEEQESSEAISLTGSGFTPGAAVDITVDGNAAGRTTAGSDGTLVYGLTAPLQRSGEREFTVTASGAGQVPVTVVSRVTALRVTVTPKKARASQTVTFSGRGFTEPGTPVYLHRMLRGRNRRTVKLAVPTGPCGTFSVRRRQFPMRRPASGTWTFRFEQDARWRAQPVRPFFMIDVLVKRRLIKG
jgi:hypothetical protein